MDNSPVIRLKEILNKLGIDLSHEARILDFGCGAGRTVYLLLDAGYLNATGYDVKDYLELRTSTDRARFFIADPGQIALPFEDNSFDLIVSEQVLEHVMDQVGMLKELHRIMRPGGHALHLFPARYSPIERHIFVPLGGVIAHRWWYKLWALLGIRNKAQRKLTADEVADLNTFFFVEALNYVPNSCYETVWNRLGYKWKWLDQEGFETSSRWILRAIGRANRIVPIFGWLNRTFNARRVYLKKCYASVTQP